LDLISHDLILQVMTVKRVIPVQAYYRSRIPGGWGSQISRWSAHEGGKAVSPTQVATTPRKHSWY